MTQNQKLTTLQAIAAIRRDAALQDLAIATRRERSIRTVLANLAATRLVNMATAEPSDFAQLDRYCQWAEARRGAVESDLAEAAKVAETCRARAVLALGRTKALEKIDLSLTAKLRAARARRA